MKAMLLRVGIDKGKDSGGCSAPIFDDGSFEYIPVLESKGVNSKETRTYANTIGRKGKPLSTYVPKSIWNLKIHYDPEFKTFTYGDPTRKRKYLLKLNKGDLLVFYAGLTPPYKNKTSLYIIGYFLVDEVIDFNNLSKKKIARTLKLCTNNAHIKNRNITDLVIAIGDKKHSKLLDKAILLSKKKYNKRGIPYQHVSDEMKKRIGISGFIQLSLPPRLIDKQKYITELKKIIKYS